MSRRPAIIAIMFASALAMPAVASAEPPADQAVRIDVDVSALPKEDRYTEDTRRWVLETQTGVLEGAGFTVSDSAREVVRIEISRYGEYGIHTRAKLMLVGDPDSLREFTCEACKDSQFIAKVGEQTARLVEHMQHEAPADDASVEAAPAAGTAPAPMETGEEEPVEPGTSDAPVDHRGRRLGAAGYAGIGALAAGIGVTVGGIVVLREEPTRRPRPGHHAEVEITDRVPLGGALVGIGAGMLIAGGVLLAVDQTVLRRRREGRARASAFAPVLWSEGAGLWWTARF